MGWLLRNRNAHKHTFGQGINLPLRVFQRRAPDVVNVPSYTVHALWSLYIRYTISDSIYMIRYTRWCLLSRPRASKRSGLHCTPRPFPPTECSALIVAPGPVVHSPVFLFWVPPTPPLLWSRLKLYSLISPVYLWFSLWLVLSQFIILVDLRIQVLTEVFFLQIHFQGPNCFISWVLISLTFQVSISSLILIPVLLGSLLDNLRPERCRHLS